MIRVLIADDHSLFRSGLRRIFSDTPDIVVVAEAENGVDTLDEARKHEWDVMLLDINMPGISGLDVLRQVKTEDPQAQILVLSMYPEAEYAISAIKFGASGYITKDSNPDQLINAIRRVARGGRYVSSDLAETLLFEIYPASELPHKKLSKRELDVFKLLVSGHSLKEIGFHLDLNVKTVSTYRTRIMEKMGMANNTQLVRYAIKHSLLE